MLCNKVVGTASDVCSLNLCLIWPTFFCSSSQGAAYSEIQCNEFVSEIVLLLTAETCCVIRLFFLFFCCNCIVAVRKAIDMLPGINPQVMHLQVKFNSQISTHCTGAF